MTPPPRPYRPALRGLAFGLGALALRACTLGVLYAVMPKGTMSKEAAAAAMKMWEVVLVVMNLAATFTALGGVGYSAIAAHRREWGVVLVLAWICSVVAVLINIEPFNHIAW